MKGQKLNSSELKATKGIYWLTSLVNLGVELDPGIEILLLFSVPCCFAILFVGCFLSYLRCVPCVQEVKGGLATDSSELLSFQPSHARGMMASLSQHLFIRSWGKTLLYSFVLPASTHPTPQSWGQEEGEHGLQRPGSEVHPYGQEAGHCDWRFIQNHIEQEGEEGSY